jgi:hypothetical protein
MSALRGWALVVVLADTAIARISANCRADLIGLLHQIAVWRDKIESPAGSRTKCPGYSTKGAPLGPRQYALISNQLE